MRKKLLQYIKKASSPTLEELEKNMLRNDNSKFIQELAILLKEKYIEIDPYFTFDSQCPLSRLEEKLKERFYSEAQFIDEHNIKNWKRSLGDDNVITFIGNNSEAIGSFLTYVPPSVSRIRITDLGIKYIETKSDQITQHWVHAIIGLVGAIIGALAVYLSVK